MTDDVVQLQKKLKIWMTIGITCLIFIGGCYIVLGKELPWRNQVLFDCPQIGDGSYVALDPHEYHPGCEYFGPPMNKR